MHITEPVGLKITFQTCILEVFGLNLGWDTSYPETCRGFTLSPGKYRDNTSIRPRSKCDSIRHR
jgi:hypothetical protein